MTRHQVCCVRSVPGNAKRLSASVRMAPNRVMRRAEQTKRVQCDQVPRGVTRIVGWKSRLQTAQPEQWPELKGDDPSWIRQPQHSALTA